MLGLSLWLLLSMTLLYRFYLLSKVFRQPVSIKIRLNFLAFIFTIFLPQTTWAACGAVPSSWPALGGSTLKVESGVKVNGLTATTGDFNGSYGVNSTTGAVQAVSPVYPTLDPATFPSFTGSTNLTAPTIVAAGTYNTITVNNGGGSVDTIFTGGTYYLNSLVIASSATVQLAPGDYYIKSTLNIGNNANIIISPAGQVRFYLNASPIIGDGVSFNNGGSAANLQIFLYPSASEFKTGNNTVFTGIVYAPSTTQKIEFGDSSIITGSLISAGKVELKNNTVLNYSPAVQAQIASINTCQGGGSSNPANFNCVEVGAIADIGHLYTKLTGLAFSFDVVALKSDGTIETGFVGSTNKNVTVELVDGSGATSCASRLALSPSVSQTLSFASTDKGRKTITPMTIGIAYANLRCRVTDANQSPSKVGCSTDNFTIRPQNFTLSQTGLGASPVVAGTNFTLTSSAGVAGYNSTPKLLPSKIKAADTTAGAQYSLATGMLTLANITNSAITDLANNQFPNAAGVPATSSLNIRYQDVGYLNFNAGSTSPSLIQSAVVDDSFTLVDQSSDCISGSGSNTAAGGKYGCEIWSNSLADIGRFKPDHFRLASSLNGSCNAGTPLTTIDDFTYMSDGHLSINATVTAESAQNIASTRYGNSCPVSGSCKLSIAAQNNTTQIDISRLQPITSLPTGTILSGVGNSSTYQSTNWLNGTYVLSGSTFQYNRGALADGPYDNFNLNFSVSDPDNVGFTGVTKTSDTKLRFGRLFMQNVYGSELLPLPIFVEAQYWNGSSYVRNQQDNCTTVPASSIAMGNYKNNLTACETQLGYSSGTGAFVNGVAKYLRLTRPTGTGNNGSVDLSVNLNSATGKTCTTASESNATAANIPWFGVNPVSRATFGIYKTPIIYMRENF